MSEKKQEQQPAPPFVSQLTQHTTPLIIQYQRGLVAVGPVIMKQLEEAGLAVVDAEEALALSGQLLHLNTTLAQVCLLNAGLQAEVEKSRRVLGLADDSDPDHPFGSPGTVMTVRPDRRRTGGARHSDDGRGGGKWSGEGGQGSGNK